jgi:UDP-N-acetylmuramate--alanine ligase
MRVYFIGIGGIGMSALAQYYLSKGWQVSGSDLEDSEIIKLLKKSFYWS